MITFCLLFAPPFVHPLTLKKDNYSRAIGAICPYLGRDVVRIGGFKSDENYDDLSFFMVSRLSVHQTSVHPFFFFFFVSE